MEGAGGGGRREEGVLREETHPPRYAVRRAQQHCIPISAPIITTAIDNNHCININSIFFWTQRCGFTDSFSDSSSSLVVVSRLSFSSSLFLAVFGQETHAKSGSGRSPSSLKLLRKVAALRGKRANETPRRREVSSRVSRQKMLRGSSTTPRATWAAAPQPSASPGRAGAPRPASWVPVLRALLHPEGGAGGLRTGQSQVKSSGAHCSASGEAAKRARLIRAVGRTERVETSQIVPQNGP